jgi:hypothetical protein
MIDELR